MFGPKSYRWEFEAMDDWTAMRFLNVLQMFEINPVDFAIVMPHEGISFMTFWCTKKMRERVEYVYRRYMKLPIYYIDPDSYQSNQEKIRRDRYLIS